MLIAAKVHGSWSPWLVSGDLLVWPSHHAYGGVHTDAVVAVRPEIEIILLIQGRRLVTWTFHAVDRLMQQGTVVLWRSDEVRTTGRNGAQLVSVQVPTRT